MKQLVDEIRKSEPRNFIRQVSERIGCSYFWMLQVLGSGRKKYCSDENADTLRKSYLVHYLYWIDYQNKIVKPKILNALGLSKTPKGNPWT